METKQPGSLAELKKAMKDPIKCVEVVTAYLDKYPICGKLGKRRGSLELTQVSDKVSAITRALLEGQAMMMDKLEFTTYMERKRRWGKTECDEEWTRMETTLGWPQDQTGPFKGYAGRVAVQKGDYVKWQTEQQHKKSVANMSKAAKVKSGEEIEALHLENAIGMASFESDSFAAIGGVAVMGKDSDAQRPLPDHASTARPSASAASGGPSAVPVLSGLYSPSSQGEQAPRAAAPLVPKDSPTQDGQRRRTLNIVSFRTTKAACVRRFQKEKAAIEEAIKKAELELVQVRCRKGRDMNEFIDNLEVCRLIALTWSGKEPKDVINGDKAAYSQSEVSLWTVAQDDKEDVAKNKRSANDVRWKNALDEQVLKPAQHPEKLQCHASISAALDKIKGCTTAEAIKSASAAFGEAKAAVIELKSALAKSMADLENQVALRDRALQRAADKAAKDAADQTRKHAETEMKRWESWRAQLKQAQVFSSHLGVVGAGMHVFQDTNSLRDVDFSKPFMVNLCPELAGLLDQEGGPVTPLLKEFFANYTKAPTWSKESRAQAQVKPTDACAELEKVFSLAAPSMTIDLSKTAGLEGLGTKIWMQALSQGFPAMSAEPQGCGSVRLAVRGEGVIVCAAATVLTKVPHIHAAKDKKISQPSILDVVSFLTTVDSAMLTELGKSATSWLYRATVPAKSILWIPPGYIVGYLYQSADGTVFRKSYALDADSGNNMKMAAELYLASPTPAAQREGQLMTLILNSLKA